MLRDLEQHVAAAVLRVQMNITAAVMMATGKSAPQSLSLWAGTISAR